MKISPILYVLYYINIDDYSTNEKYIHISNNIILFISRHKYLVNVLLYEIIFNRFYPIDIWVIFFLRK